jgi:hypothetical protein
MHDTAVCDKLLEENFLITYTQVKAVFISQTASVSSFNYLHLVEGSFAEVR